MKSIIVFHLILFTIKKRNTLHIYIERGLYYEKNYCINDYSYYVYDN